jgi:hypothetical protein
MADVSSKPGGYMWMIHVSTNYCNVSNSIALELEFDGRVRVSQAGCVSQRAPGWCGLCMRDDRDDARWTNGDVSGTSKS